MRLTVVALAPFVALVGASHDTYSVCSTPEITDFCYFDPCPPSYGDDCPSYAPNCQGGICACGGVIAVGYGGAEGVENAFGGITTTCLLSAAGCPAHAPLPPTFVQPAVATSFGRAADGTIDALPISTTCASLTASTDTVLTPAQCMSHAMATKAFLEESTTLNGNGETYLVPCPRENSPFTAADYSGWIAHEFPSQPPAGASKDPHFKFAHGGRADIRGEPGMVYNLLSHRNVSMNVQFEAATFVWSKRVVHGTKMSAAFWTLKTRGGKMLTVDMTLGNTSGAGGHATKPKATVFDGVTTTVVTEGVPFTSANVRVALVNRKLTVTNGAWEMSAAMRPFPFATLNQGKTLLDVALKPLYDVETDVLSPHGLLGQSFDGDDADFDGAMDTDRSAETTTRAQGEGAIEGHISDYQLKGPYATEFTYSRFGKAAAKPRDTSKLSGKKLPKSASYAAVASAPVDMVEEA